MISFQAVISSDIPIIQELAHKSWNESYKVIISQEQIDFMLSTMYSTDKLSEELNNPKFHWYFTQYQGQNIGFICFKEEKNQVFLSKLYLLESFKGKGVGKRAIGYVEDFCIQNNYTSFRLRVNKLNPAVQFYQSCGLQIIKEDILDLGHGFIMDDYIMEKRLDYNY